MKTLAAIISSTLLFSAVVTGQQKDAQMMHARGTFTVDIKPLTPPPAEGINRLSIDKKLSGDLQGSTQGEMFTAGDPQHGVAGYVAIETFTGTLSGKRGGFVLQHHATMDKSGRNMSVIVVPGSGCGELAGIEGNFAIDIVNGQHSYDLAYTLPR